MEKKYKELERDVTRLKKKMKDSSDDQGSSTSSESTTINPGPNSDELLKGVSHLSTSDLAVVLRTLVHKVFTTEEVLGCSRTGKKTVNSGETPRPALNKDKFEALQTAVMKKCQISIDVFKKKFDNFLKMERRKNRTYPAVLNQ